MQPPSTLRSTVLLTSFPPFRTARSLQCYALHASSRLFSLGAGQKEGLRWQGLKERIFSMLPQDDFTKHAAFSPDGNESSPEELAEEVDNIQRLIAGEVVPFPLDTCMTIIRKEGTGDLTLHSVVPADEALVQRVSELGTVRRLIAPNLQHWCYVQGWLEAFPSADLYVAPHAYDEDLEDKVSHEDKKRRRLCRSHIDVCCHMPCIRCCCCCCCGCYDCVLGWMCLCVCVPLACLAFGRHAVAFLFLNPHSSSSSVSSQIRWHTSFKARRVLSALHRTGAVCRCFKMDPSSPQPPSPPTATTTTAAAAAATATARTVASLSSRAGFSPAQL